MKTENKLTVFGPNLEDQSGGTETIQSIMRDMQFAPCVTIPV